MGWARGARPPARPASCGCPGNGCCSCGKAGEGAGKGAEEALGCGASVLGRDVGPRVERVEIRTQASWRKWGEA